MAIELSNGLRQGLESGSLGNILPEVYLLRGIIENGRYHAAQDIFNHTLNVISDLEYVMDEFEFGQPITGILNNHLDSQVGARTWRELLRATAVIHDTLKPETMITTGETTACLLHEVMAGEQVKNYSDRLGLGPRDEEVLQVLVGQHDLPHWVINLISARGELSKWADRMEDITNGCHIGLTLFYWADLLGSDIRSLQPEEFAQRQSMIISLLKYYLQ